jgi:hypothetical protein
MAKQKKHRYSVGWAAPDHKKSGNTNVFDAWKHRTKP